MTPDQTTRAKNLVLGALTADAAAMGLHWIYDQDHLAKIAAEAPEFHAPDAANYAGVPAYFAHPTRGVGDPSQYGEQALVMLRALLANGGAYDASGYGAAFRSHFGYGGGYVGYIDHATRDTLDNFRRSEDACHASAQALAFDGPAAVTRTMVNTALALRSKFDGDTLRAEFEQAVRRSHDDDALVAHGFAVLGAVLAQPPATGAQDEQLPAIAKLPALVAQMALADDAAFEAAVASAVRTTSDHPTAAAFGQVCARMMQAAITTGDMDTVVTAAHAHGSPATNVLLTEAAARQDQDNRSVTKHFGMACDLNYGVPSALHNMLSADSYTTAIRANILAGGDTCGRAILLGAVMGAIHGAQGAAGIPADWAAKLTHGSELAAGLDALLG